MPTSGRLCSLSKVSLPIHSVPLALLTNTLFITTVLVSVLLANDAVAVAMPESNTVPQSEPEAAIQSSISTDQQLSDDELPALHFGFRSTYQTFYHNSVYAQWLDAALAKVGYQSKISWMPNKRIVNLVEHGVLDGNLALAPTSIPKPSRMVQIPEVFISACFAGYRLKSQKFTNSTSNSDNSLKSDSSSQNSPTKIGLLSASESLEALPKRYWKNPIIQHLPDAQAALRMLQSKRIDYLVVHMPSSQTLQQLYGMELVKSTPILGRFDSYIYLHNSHTALAPALAQALQETRPDSLRHVCREP